MIRIVLLATSLLIPSLVPAVEISNFKSGLACTDGKTFGWICHETSDIYITGQGKCIYNKQEKPCTWHGFSFDYKEVTEETEIKCTVKSSKPTNLGNPKEQISNNKLISEFILPVQIGEGHFFNPQYRILSYNDGDPNLIETTSCFSEGKLIFEINNRYIYPSNPNK